MSSTLIVILVILAAIFICYQSNESYYQDPTSRRGPSFPKTGICTQKCRDYCGYGEGCTLACLTEVNGNPTMGCSNMRKTPGTVDKYPCHRVTTSRNNEWSHSCMKDDSQ